MVSYKARFGLLIMVLVLAACSQQGAGPAQGVDPPKPSGEGAGALPPGGVLPGGGYLEPGGLRLDRPSPGGNPFDGFGR